MWPALSNLSEHKPLCPRLQPPPPPLPPVSPHLPQPWTGSSKKLSISPGLAPSASLFAFQLVGCYSFVLVYVFYFLYSMLASIHFPELIGGQVTGRAGSACSFTILEGSGNLLQNFIYTIRSHYLKYSRECQSKEMAKATNYFIMMHTYLKYFNLKIKKHTQKFLKYPAIATERKPVHVFFFFKERIKESSVTSWCLDQGFFFE